MNTTPDHTTTSLGTIVVEKSQLLAKLRENRTTHEEIFKAACEGFWVKTKEALEEKRKGFSTASEASSKSFQGQYTEFFAAAEAKDRTAIKSFQSPRGGFSPFWTLDLTAEWVPQYPTNHLEDYDRAITMLEFSVADKVQLNVNEFDAYVRNSWKWKDEFANSNLELVRCVTGSLAVGNSGFLDSKLYSYAVSGCLAL